MKKSAGLLLLFALLFPLTLFAKPSLTQEQKQFAHRLATQDHFNEGQVRTWLLKSEPDFSVVEKTKHPKEDISWSGYRRLFVTDKNINDGLVFYQKHKQAFRHAHAIYGVDSATIVAIIGIESHYGSHLGTHNTAKALNTLAFFNKRRHKLFQEQLRSLFILSRQLKIDPLSINGSYTGALGQPQFMPKTYLSYAVSKTAGASDLFHNPDDAIYSVANFLRKMGWQRNEAIATPVAVTHGMNSHFLQFSENGIPKQWQKDFNFTAVHHYNQSNKYVLVVAELAREIRKKL